MQYVLTDIVRCMQFFHRLITRRTKEDALITVHVRQNGSIVTIHVGTSRVNAVAPLNMHAVYMPEILMFQDEVS